MLCISMILCIASNQKPALNPNRSRVSDTNGKTVEHGSASVEEPDILVFEIAPGGLGVDIETKAWSW